MTQRRLRSSTWVRTCVLGSALTLAMGMPAWAVTAGFDHGTAQGESPHPHYRFRADAEFGNEDAVGSRPFTMTCPPNHSLQL